MSKLLLGVAFLVLTSFRNGDLWQSVVRRDHIIDVQDCQQCYFSRSNSSLAKMLSQLSVRGGNELPTANPNPFKQQLQVSVQSDSKVKKGNARFSLSLLNESGVILSSKPLVTINSLIEFDTKIYPAGVYFLVLKGTDGTVQNSTVVKLNK